MPGDDEFLECVKNLDALLWHDDVETAYWLRSIVKSRIDVEQDMRDMQVWHLQWWI